MRDQPMRAKFAYTLRAGSFSSILHAMRGNLIFVCHAPNFNFSHVSCHRMQANLADFQNRGARGQFRRFDTWCQFNSGNFSAHARDGKFNNFPPWHEYFIQFGGMRLCAIISADFACITLPSPNPLARYHFQRFSAFEFALVSITLSRKSAYISAY